MTLFQASTAEHLALAKHLTAEVKTEEFVAGRGVVVKWERLRRQNHWFDALYNACAAGSFCGVRLVDELGVPKVRKSGQRAEGRLSQIANEYCERLQRYRRR